MSDIVKIDVKDVTKVVADVLQYLDFIKEHNDEPLDFNPDAIDAVQHLLVDAYIDKVQSDKRICPF